MKIIACDIGGTEIKGALFNESIIRMSTHKTNQAEGKESILNSLFKVIDELLEEGVVAIGLVTAGAVDITTGEIVSNTGTLDGWLHFSLKREVENKYHLPCFIDNDANGAMIGEMDEYLEKGVLNAAMITLGTGVGTALYINGKIYRGSHYQVEFGHIPLYPEGVACTCGKLGCAEAYLSGSYLTKQAKLKIDSSITSGKVLFDYYLEGNEIAKKIIEEYVSNLILFLDTIEKMVDPEVIIIGGGVISSKEIIFPLIEKECQKRKLLSKIIPAKHGNFAGIRGAYFIALEGIKHEKN